MAWVNKSKPEMIEWSREETPEIDTPYAALRHRKKIGDDAHDMDGEKNVKNRFSKRSLGFGEFAILLYPAVMFPAMMMRGGGIWIVAALTSYWLMSMQF